MAPRNFSSLIRGDRVTRPALKPAPRAADRSGMLNLFRPRLPGPLPMADCWEAVRRPGRHTDEALTGTTRIWLRKLVPGRRPQQLCVLYPRLANQLAWHWRDPALTLQLLDELLVDRRGGRRGFPRVVVVELRRLRDLVEHPDLPGPPAGYWQSLRQAWSGH